VQVFRGCVLFYRGDVDQCISIFKSVLEKHPHMEGIHPLFAIFLAASGRKDEARAHITEEARALAKADHDIAYWMASANAGLGEKDQAFKWLERAVKLGNENRPWFETDKCLAPLRDDPRFDVLMRKIVADRAA
jgi:tetratricopeptide (TPR) repeat protein